MWVYLYVCRAAVNHISYTPSLNTEEKKKLPLKDSKGTLFYLDVTVPIWLTCNLILPNMKRVRTLDMKVGGKAQSSCVPCRKSLVIQSVTVFFRPPTFFQTLCDISLDWQGLQHATPPLSGGFFLSDSLICLSFNIINGVLSGRLVMKCDPVLSFGHVI